MNAAPSYSKTGLPARSQVSLSRPLRLSGYILAALVAAGAVNAPARSAGCHNSIGPVLESTSIEVRPIAVRADGYGVWLRFMLYSYGRGTGEPWAGLLIISLDGRDMLSVSSQVGARKPTTIHLYYVPPGQHEIGLRMSNPWNGYVGFTTCVALPGSHVVRHWRRW